jgi:hypothetical protein
MSFPSSLHCTQRIVFLTRIIQTVKKILQWFLNKFYTEVAPSLGLVAGGPVLGTLPLSGLLLLLISGLDTCTQGASVLLRPPLLFPSAGSWNSLGKCTVLLWDPKASSPGRLFKI